jgi:MinD-like ATPase involved in chromosome partitioning or flagellar assembly
MTESENRPEVTEDGDTAGTGSAGGDRSGRTGVTRPAGRRPISILPWEAAEPSPEAPPRGGGRPPARRAPVPPSGLLSAPAPANRTGADDPFASLPPWLPPVRRPTPPRPPRTGRPTGPGQRGPGLPGGGLPGGDGYRGEPGRRGDGPRTGGFRGLSEPDGSPRTGESRGLPEPDGSPRTGANPVPRGPLGPPHQPPGPRTPVEGWTSPGGRPSYPRALEPPALPRPGRGEPGTGFSIESVDPGLPVEPVIGLTPPAAPNPAAPNPAANPAAPNPATVEPAAAPITAAPPPSVTATPADLAPAVPAPPTPLASPEPTAPATSAPAVPAPAALDLAALERVEPRRRLTADSIRHEQVVAPDRPVPRFGWRASVYAATGGRVNLGIGAAERDWLELLDQVRRPLAGARQIAVMSIKGGVGKTTVAACLGLMLAEYRGDGVVAVDADPDAGTLADRLSGVATSTVRDLLDNLDKIKSLSQFTEYTSLAGRLRVLAGDQDPAMGEAFRREEYQRVCRALARYFDIVITDSGTGLVHSAMRGTLELADRLIVVGSPTVDGASRASKTLDWLLAHGHERLVEDAVLVLCQDRGSHRVDRAQLYRHFAERCRHVIEIPADPHLYSGGVIDPAMLQPVTREAYVRLAAVVADGFSAPAALWPAGR